MLALKWSYADKRYNEFTAKCFTITPIVPIVHLRSTSIQALEKISWSVSISSDDEGHKDQEAYFFDSSQMVKWYMKVYLIRYFFQFRCS
ncbi:hypothetical protein NPIL_677071 [Nephila pilipes]|uniref:Uncharacterized protein n=1 Tax=Nephila pilipes TaxID=299642 RepID=A0A8X6U720_NEPPI|nr:hypothetical protein NPIL_677071 [Nephila pilipes]